MAQPPDHQELSIGEANKGLRGSRWQAPRDHGPWGTSTAGSDSSDWQMLAADAIAGVNQVLWRNNTACFLHLWNLDANSTLQSTSGADGFNTPRAWELETRFQVDGNRDGLIGAPFSTD